jgi:hypothetical protein
MVFIRAVKGAKNSAGVACCGKKMSDILSNLLFVARQRRKTNGLEANSATLVKKSVALLR